ncbi:conserved hypothetical protein [Hahella chejuensis KCTC 2396]|uniref:Right handed beta helix domain-containing protein n=1 Tax=Hahella chejuensis (strain KCTC 2396) TaxID=349521 RepID=Q2SM76_HAHCH|nr:parallel beta-helix domain-containing protein [Hahella chejuensis]ABC28248.1 conserved hypothetical protein [Hahella chejuensis KCTC 2396]
MKIHQLIIHFIAFTISIGQATSLYAKEHKVDKNNFSAHLYKLLDRAENGDTIILPHGNFFLDRELRVSTKGLTITGAGPRETILDFSNQKQGAQALFVRGWNITLKNFSIAHPGGDGVVIRNSSKVLISNLRINMGEAPKSSNGGYGIYPVSSRHITIENTEVSGASDAGIYIGQSIYTLIQNNYSHDNVTGVNAENSQHVHVKNNRLQNNTVGALIVSLPDMLYPKSDNIIFEENIIDDNNLKNFALEGNVVSQFSPGIGIALIATSNVFINSTVLSKNDNADILIAGYHFLNRPPYGAAFTPWVKSTSISNPFGAVNILWDGETTEEDPLPLCVSGEAVVSTLGQEKKVITSNKLHCSLSKPEQFEVMSPDV